MTSNALQARPEAAHGELESVIQLNAVVVNNIPKQYTHVVLEMCEAERKSIIWRSTLVTVAKGTATFNFWARFVTKRKTVLISVIPTAPPASKLWKKLRLEPLVASLHLPSAESTAEAVWDQHVLQLTEKTYLDRAFNKLDLDGNGLITVDEIQARLGSINSSPSTSSVDAMEIEVWREAPVLSAHSSVAFSSS
eukprot:gene2421-8740_t